MAENRYQTDQTNLHAIVKHMAVSATVVKAIVMVIFVTLLLIDYPIFAKAIVGVNAFIVAWFADARFLQYEREIRAKCELTRNDNLTSAGTFWSWSVAPYYGILLTSLLLLLLSKVY